MNCSRCNTPLEEGARFCRICGLPVPVSAPVNPNPFTPQPQQVWQAAPPNQWQSPQPPQQPQPIYQPQQQSQPSYQPSQPPQPYQTFQPTQQAQPPQQYYQQAPAPLTPANTPQGWIEPGQFAQPLHVEQPKQPVPNLSQSPVPRKRRWPKRTLITLLVLVVLLVGGWFLALRPVLHAFAQSQLDQTINNSAAQIIPVPPPINSLPVSESMINNLIAANESSSNPVQNAVIHIATPVFASDGSYTGGIQLNFQVYGFSCSVTAILQASNGGMIVSHLQISGIISWIMSSSELTASLNAHLHDIVGQLGRTITGVTIKNQEIDLALG